jgi:hypothetical protein
MLVGSFTHCGFSLYPPGCCGEKELLKLVAFNMTQHDAMVVLDVDAMVLNSLDEAIDLLLDRTVPRGAASHIMFHPERPIPDDVWLLYTADYANGGPFDIDSKDLPPVQGGFMIVKPNRTLFEDILEVVREGNIVDGRGWGTGDGPYTGWYYGAVTFQGLMPYYFHILNPNHSIEMHGCRYNHLSVGPTISMGVPGTNRTEDRCFTNREVCEDCRDKNLDDLSSFHLTYCRKPWDCVPHWIDAYKGRLCRQALRRWFDFRTEMEMSWGRPERNHSVADDGPEALYLSDGYCRGRGPDSYVPIRLPFDSP